MGKNNTFGGFVTGFDGKFDGLSGAMGEAEKRPLIGVTQGGSSRKGGGAKPAAKDVTKVNNGQTKKG